METMAPVDLDVGAMRRVVDREGGCVVWGGAVELSPADDTLIRVERALDLDSDGQLIASVLSKKIAAGSTHLVIDIPVGKTAKIRSDAAAATLSASLMAVADQFGLKRASSAAMAGNRSVAASDRPWRPSMFWRFCRTSATRPPT